MENLAKDTTPLDWYGDKMVITEDEPAYTMLPDGSIKQRANNFWMKMHTSPDPEDEFLSAQLQATDIADLIQDSEDKKRFLELSLQLRTVAPWELVGEARWKNITSPAANKIYLEMYTIARRNGVSNIELFT